MRVLITGAGGFVGQALCVELNTQHYDVIAITRSNDIVNGCKTLTVGNINGETEWSTALIGVDVVVHLAARVHIMHDDAVDPLAAFREVNVEGTLNLARQAANAGVKRFIFLSSIGVNGAQSKKPFTELDIPHPHSPYAFSKLEAELGLEKVALETGMKFVIIRSPLVYGSAAPGNFSRLIRIVRRQAYLPLATINNKRSFVYVGNLVSLILKCIEHPAAKNQIFLVSDGQDISTTELLKMCANAMGVKSRLLPMPQKLLIVGASLLGKRDVALQLCGDLQVDFTKACELLDWIPPYSVAEGLRATVLGVMDK
jgi:nucleoside-diphosphate-sugar epimerase